MVAKKENLDTERRWHYSRNGMPIVGKLSPRCEHFDWAHGRMNMNVCGNCRWFFLLDGTKQTYRCFCEKRRVAK